jgi:hypothetical protein
MLPGSVEARAKIKVTFLQLPLVRSFAVAPPWRFDNDSRGAAETISAIAAIMSRETFIFVDDNDSFEKEWSERLLVCGDQQERVNSEEIRRQQMYSYTLNISYQHGGNSE